MQNTTDSRIAAQARGTAAPPSVRPQTIFRPGDTCWRIERASRFALIVDAADYFAAAKAAMLNAKHAIVLIGWDFDLRIHLTPDRHENGVPDQLGAFLKEIVRSKPGLQIFLLKWDMALAYTLSRMAIPLLAIELMARGRTHLRFDSTHPWSSAHHQKIVVIDDALAFCGGIDMTSDRWDTREHAPDDDHRVRPNGSPYPPWHDATVAVDGAAARALGELARQRWHFATGEDLPPPVETGDPWPACIEPQLRDVDVAIARTMPAYDGRAEILEIEKLYVAAIRSARRVIYLESQYFASVRICEELSRRLGEVDGPEIVVLNPNTAEGWLEERTMGAARSARLEEIEAADRYNRFRIYYPVNDAGQPIYVHAKILIVDDRFLRAGSSNVNNRSMGFDSECDLAVEAAGEGHRAAVLRARNDLLAEHLGRSVEEVEDAIDGRQSVIGAIEALRRTEGRTLTPLAWRSTNAVEEAVLQLHVADPERPAHFEARITHAVKRAVLSLRPRSCIAFALGLAAGLAMSRTVRALGSRRPQAPRALARGANSWDATEGRSTLSDSYHVLSYRKSPPNARRFRSS